MTAAQASSVNHAYSRSDGFEILAGQDVTDKRYKTTRYLLVFSQARKINKAVILTARGNERTHWQLFAEGKLFEMHTLFEKLDAPEIN